MSQKRYSRRFEISRPGFLDGTGEPRVPSYRNSANSASDEWTLTTPATVDANASYKVVAGGFEAIAPTGPATTQAELDTLLLKAIRNSDIVNIAIPVLDEAAHKITLVHRDLGVPMTVTVNSAETTNDIVLAHTVTAAISTSIPFGVFVSRKVGDPIDEVRLPNATTDRIRGISLTTYAEERDRIGPDAITAYKPNDMLDVIDRTNECEGIWVEAVEPDITVDDLVYVSVANDGTAGYATKNSVGTIAVPHASFVTNTERYNGGKGLMVKVSINLP